MKVTWVLGSAAAVSVWCTLAACSGSSGGAGNTATGGNATTSTTTTASSSSSSSSSSGTSTGGSTTTSSSTVTDPVCTNPQANVSGSCLDCVSTVSSNDPCLQQFSTACQSNSSCSTYSRCEIACANATMDAGLQGAGGGGTACVAGDMATDAGTPFQNCVGCCASNNPDGYSAFIQARINACACNPGATCASACAM